MSNAASNKTYYSDSVNPTVTRIDENIVPHIVAARHAALEEAAKIAKAYSSKLQAASHKRVKQNLPNIVSASKADAGRSIAQAIRAAAKEPPHEKA